MCRSPRSVVPTLGANRSSTRHFERRYSGDAAAGPAIRHDAVENLHAALPSQGRRRVECREETPPAPERAGDGALSAILG